MIGIFHCVFLSLRDVFAENILTVKGILKNNQKYFYYRVQKLHLLMKAA